MPANCLHVVVIDDNKNILEMVKVVLELEKYKVSTFEHFDDFKPLLEENKPDVIVCDLHMSGVDGRDVCMELKSNPETASIPFIILTAHPHAKDSCFAAGVDFFMEKPFDIDNLFSTVTEAIKLKEKVMSSDFA